jgi:hypothetical protein
MMIVPENRVDLVVEKYVKGRRLVEKRKGQSKENDQESDIEKPSLPESKYNRWFRIIHRFSSRE